MNYSFNSEKHGYCRKEVDAFISESEKKLDELKAEISTLKTRLDEKEKADELLSSVSFSYCPYSMYA